MPDIDTEELRRKAEALLAMDLSVGGIRPEDVLALIVALDAKDREIKRLIATRERLVIERDFEHNRWITDGEDNLAMRAAKEAEIERLRADREMIARCEPYRRAGACHCSAGIPGPCALEASEADRG